jgi:hypothetical protein
MQLSSVTCTIGDKWQTINSRDGGKMKLNTNPFPISLVELEHKKILVHTDQDEMTKGKNVVIYNNLHNRMIMPHNLNIVMWNENVQRKPAQRAKPTSALLIEKYQW